MSCYADQDDDRYWDHYEIELEQERDDDRGSGPSGICSCCGKDCDAVSIDEGIGSYEFWGSKGVHHDYRWVSPCCEEEVVDGKCKCIEAKEVVAKKRYHVKRDIYIEIGERYMRYTYRSYRTGGPSWITVEHHKIYKPYNPAKPVQLTVVSNGIQESTNSPH